MVIELVLGIIIGPALLDLAEHDKFIDFFSNLGLGMLFFFAGYEIDFERIKGRPLMLGILGWLVTLALAYSVGGLLAWAGVVLSLLYTGSAMSTTAIGTLIPILNDAERSRPASGRSCWPQAMGEFGPILLITLVFSTKGTLSGSLILIAFVGVAVVTALVAVRGATWGWNLLERTLQSQRPARDPNRGGTGVRAGARLGPRPGPAARRIRRRRDRPRGAQGPRNRHVRVEADRCRLRLLHPVLLRCERHQVQPRRADRGPDPVPQGADVPRAVPVRARAAALLLYRGELDLKDRAALAFFSATQLPLVVAITTIAIEQGHMRSSTAAALVAAAILSTLIYPLIGLKLREGRAGLERRDEPAEAPAPG